MARSTPKAAPIHPYARQGNQEQLSNTSNFINFNNNSTTSSHNHSARPTLSINPRNYEDKKYPSIQWKEDKNKRSINKFEEDSSSIVESSSGSDEQGRSEEIHTASEPTLSSRPSSIQKTNVAINCEAPLINSFRHMPEDVIRKILLDHIIDLNDIPTRAKNLMHFASISKFNREFVRNLLTEEVLREVSFEITKSAIPDLLARLAENKKAKFTEADINDFVYHWPYLTFDCSYQEEKNKKGDLEDIKFTKRGLKLMNKIVCHPNLRELRVISKQTEECDMSESIRVRNNNGLVLIYSLLSRESPDPLMVDFIFNNWVPPFTSKFRDKNGFLDLIKKTQDRADSCNSIRFGEIDLSRGVDANFFADIRKLDHKTPQQKKFRFNFVKMICNIALSHFAHTISLRGLFFSDERLALLLNEIQLCDKSSLQHLDLRGNYIKEDAFQSLIELLKSENICLKTIKLSYAGMPKDKITILADALKNNFTLELVEIYAGENPINLPAINDERIKIIKKLI